MEDKIKIIFKNNLNKIMEMRGKTQADLCRYMDVSSATVSDWCNGKKMPRTDKIQSIANWLLVEMSDLLEEKDEVTNYYLNEDSRDLAQFLFENPNYKVLFDASRKVKAEDIMKVKQMIDLINGE